MLFSKKQTIAILLIALVLLGGVGSYYLLKDFQKTVLGYNVDLVSILLKNREGESEFLASIDNIRFRLADGGANEEIVSALERLFSKKDFRVEILQALKAIDEKDGRTVVDNWQALIDEQKSKFASKKFNELWAVLLKVSIIKKQAGQSLTDITDDHLYSMMVVIDSSSSAP